MNKTRFAEMEKRQSIRLEKTLPVKFNLSDSHGATGTYEALSRNIGEGGAFVETDLISDESAGLTKQSIIYLEIELLGHAETVKSRAEITWISKKSRVPQKRKSGFGLKFLEISSGEKQAISSFISKETLAQTSVVEKEIPSILREQKLTDRQRRNLQILDTIRKNRLISRAEISKATGINIVTVSNYIDTYLKKGLVFERGLDISTGGRRPELIEVNPRYGYVVGIDLGDLNTQNPTLQVLATDFTSQIKVSEKTKREDGNIEDSLEGLGELIAEVIASEDLERTKIRGIGVGISGIMDKFGGTVRNPLTGSTVANYVAIKKDLEQRFNLPVFIENSANCALFAEKWSGVSPEAKSAENMIYLLSDNQCAIMLRGELYSGLSKSAGQLNLNLPHNNFSSHTVCWTSSSSNCIVRSQDQDFNLDSLAKEDIARYGASIGAKVAYLVNVFNPQVVVIGSHFNRLGDVFLDALRSSVNRWAFRESANIVRIIPASLSDEAVALGAASLVIESALANI